MAWQTDTATAAAIAAAIAGSADKITELSALSTSLGSGPLTLEIKHAASGFTWGSATTVLLATMTGAHVISAGKLRPGQVTGVTTAIGVNLAAGEAWARVSNGVGRYVQAPLDEVTADGGFTVPRSPTTDSNTVRAMILGNTFGFAGSSNLAASPDIQLKVRTLRNTSATTQPAGFVTPMFGQGFVMGQIPVGTYPHFRTAGGLACPASLGGIVTWPDGSMKFCSVFLQVPISVPGNGTIDLQVRSGGNAPAVGTRTLSEAAAANISVEIVGVTNLTGTYTGGLADAVTANIDVGLFSDGPAGRVWRVLGEMKQGGTAHDQLALWHYVQALSNANGTLKGLRYLGKVEQPWGDVGLGLNSTSPVIIPGAAPMHRVVTGSLKVGATTVRAFNGHNTTETPGPEIGMAHYTGFFTAGLSGEYDYVQGGGTDATDCTIQVLEDMNYLMKTRLVLPNDPTQTLAPSPTSVYRPYGNAGMARAMQSGGNRDDIAVMPSFDIRHMLRQSKADEQNVRVAALAMAGLRFVYMKKSTKSIIPALDIKPSYAKLGVTNNSWRYWPSNGPNETVGIQSIEPSTNPSLWSSEYEPSHKPSPTYYAYLTTGEPQFLDTLLTHAASTIFNSEGGSKKPRVTHPITRTTLMMDGTYGRRDIIMNGVTYKGGGWFFDGGQTRIMAWGSRDIAMGAAMAPDVCPYGSGIKEYLNDAINGMYVGINTYNELVGPEWEDGGILDFDVNYADPWCHGYMSLSMCFQYEILRHPEILKMRRRQARYWKYTHEAIDLPLSYNYITYIYDENGVRVNNPSGMMYSVGQATMAFDTGTNRYTLSDTHGAWQLRNGDVVAFDDGFSTGGRPFAYVNRRLMYVVNASGFTGQLSYSPGGVPITVTSSVNVQVPFVRTKNFEPRPTAESFQGPGTYMAIIAAACNYHEAVGDGDLIQPARIRADRAIAERTEPWDYTGDPKNDLLPYYPA